MVPVSLFPLGKRIVPADGNSYSAFGPDVIGPGPTGSSEDLRLR